MPSVLRPWVMELELREQGTLLTAIRGCDLTPKEPLDSLERQLTAAIRYAVMVPADEREVDSEPGCFMISAPPKRVRVSRLGHYPQHWVSHLMHAAEVLGYRCPNSDERNLWYAIYLQFCDALHVNPETEPQYMARMTEDRILRGTVVS